jgi:putative nucleotidyltransferase with HDIG domain
VDCQQIGGRREGVTVAKQSVGDARHWHARPAHAFLIRALVFALPVAASIGVGVAAGELLPHPATRAHVVLWWIALLALSTAGLYAADKLARRLLPLATLMRLSMLFPDHAPSRLKVARRFAGSRAIARELETAHRDGVMGTRQEAAETILALVGALGEYDSRTRGHSERTQLYVTMLADELGLKAEDRGRLMWAALVHDIGKLKVPHEVLNKPGQPTADEWHVLHSHPVEGAAICEPLREWLGEWWLAIEQHHERYDGTGYPRGLAGKEISYGARIVAVADSYEVMTAARAYKRPMTAEAARQELSRCAGTQFDPDVVRAFLNISLGEMSRLSGPLAWLAQLLLIRPGPLMGQVIGASAGVAATASTVAALSLGPAVAATVHHQASGDVPTSSHTVVGGGPSDASDAPRGSDSTQPTPSGSPTAAPMTSATGSPTSVPPPGPTPSADTTGSPTAITVQNDVVTTPEDVAVSVDVTANDSSPGGPLSVVAVAGAAHGSTTAGPDAVISYVPDPDYNGPDSWTYTARDEAGATASGTVSVTVTAVNDPPDAVDDLARLDEDSGPTEVAVLRNDADPDGDSLRVVAVSSSQHGTATATARGVSYVPAPDFNGADEFTYTVADGHGGTTTAAVSVHVLAVNDPPVVGPAAYAATVGHRLTVNAANGVLASASDADGDHLAVVGDDSAAVDIAPDGSLTYLPLLPGQRTVSFRVSDGHVTTTGTVTITVTLASAGQQNLYLQPADTDEIGDLTVTAPTGGVADWDSDGKPGLTIKSSDLKESENDQHKYQIWSYVAPTGGLTLNGPVTLDLWTSAEGRADQDIEYAAWVYECGPGGGSCATLLATGKVAVHHWSTTTSWEERELTVGSIDATIAADHLLRLRLMFNKRDIWMPLDSAHPSRLTLTTG